MTWENDKNETATQIYSFIADFDEKIYANEERREDSLIQQAAHMQTAFSFVSAALFMVAAIIIDNRGRISLEFLLVEKTLENKPLKEIQNAPENPLLGVTTSEPLIRTINFEFNKKKKDNAH